MGSPIIVFLLSRTASTTDSQWLNLDSRRRKSTQLNLPSMSMTSRETVRSMPSMLVTSCAPATSTPPSRPSPRSEVRPRRERRCSQRPTSSPCTRAARTPRTRVDSTTLLKSSSSTTNEDNTMLENELFRLLTNLGEKLTKEEAKGLMKELCDPADDDGFIPFIPFLEKMCAAEK